MIFVKALLYLLSFAEVSSVQSLQEVNYWQNRLKLAADCYGEEELSIKKMEACVELASLNIDVVERLSLDNYCLSLLENNTKWILQVYDRLPKMDSSYLPKCGQQKENIYDDHIYRQKKL